ncbi:MAG: SusC/RagA family TonB-linked outer membrane protein [Bacteroidia bacterium]|nr:SusC/RagA family TonB-linked outer membrane protein [Bacteroidia bacterium]
MRNLFTILCLLFSAALLQAQGKVVTGTVTAEGDPLPGVTVVEKGTSNGAFTNDQGNYRITVSENATTLEFRFVGMKTIEAEISGTTVNIEMAEDELLLDEVVVTALGIKQEKKQLGYAVQSVGGDALTKSGEVNAISGLAGKVAGVQVISSSGSPGGSSFIRIRGSSSLTGSNQPLVIIDGVPMDNSQLTAGNPDDGSNNLLSGVALSNRAIDINPDDIENVTVLKGPAATALYGIQAANGALVITTKKGSATEGKSVNVSFSTTIAFDEVNRLPKMQDQYVQGTGWYDVDANGDPLPTWYGPGDGWPTSWGPKADTMYWDNSGDDSYSYDSHGNLVGQSNPNKGEKFVPYDNLTNFFQRGVTTTNNLALSGGNSATTYRLSVGDVNQKGIVPLSQFRRTTVRAAGSSQLSSKFRVSSSVGYVKSGGRRIQQGSNTSGLMLGLARTPISFDNANGLEDPINNPLSYTRPDGTQRNYRGGGGYDNPYWTINNNPFEDDVNRVYGYMDASYDVTSWLNVFYRLGTDFYSDRRTSSFEIGSRTSPAGRIYEEQHNYRHVNSDLWITLKKDFTEDLNGSLLIGHNAYVQKYQRLYTQGDAFAFPGFTQISNASSVLTRETTDNYRKTAIFANAKLAYKDYLFLDLTARNEWSSSLPDNSRDFFYPSASVGFVFTDAFGLQDNKVLPYGKLRLSWAQAGNDAPTYSTKTPFQGANFADGWTNGIVFPFGGVSGFTQSALLGNPNLRPEKTNSFEVGADLRFLKNRLGIDITYYSAVTEDQILPVAIAASSGYRTFTTNAGKVSNKGIELVLNFTPVKTKDFRWDAQINFTKNKNLVVELAEGLDNIFIGGFEGSAIRHIAGQPYGVIQGGAWLRDPNGNLVIESDTTSYYYGYPLADQTEQVIGNPNPNFLMGFRNTLSYKGITFTFLLDWRNGGQIWNGTEGALTYFGTSELTENRGTTTTFSGVKGTIDGDGNVIYQDENGNQGTFQSDAVVALNEDWYTFNGGGFGELTENFVQKADFIKLREIGINYALPSTLLGKTFLKNVEVGVSARNFLLWTPYNGIDPETNLMGANNAQGLDYFNMPNTQSYILNLKVNF